MFYMPMVILKYRILMQFPLEIHFCRKQRKSQLSDRQIELALVVLANLNEWHIQFSIQLSGGRYRLLYKFSFFFTNLDYINGKSRKFCDVFGLLCTYLSTFSNESKSNFVNNLKSEKFFLHLGKVDFWHSVFYKDSSIVNRKIACAQS